MGEAAAAYPAIGLVPGSGRVQRSSHVSLCLSLSLSYPCPNLLNDPQLCVPLECQQEEASQHSEAGPRLPWQRWAGAASLGGFGRSPSELGYSRLRCLWL